MQVHDRELGALAPHELEGLGPVAGLEHLEAEPCEDLAQRLAQGVVVVGNEDAALAHESGTGLAERARPARGVPNLVARLKGLGRRGLRLGIGRGTALLAKVSASVRPVAATLSARQGLEGSPCIDRSGAGSALHADRLGLGSALGPRALRLRARRLRSRPGGKSEPGTQRPGRTSQSPSATRKNGSGEGAGGDSGESRGSKASGESPAQPAKTRPSPKR